jgi:hypothetical protein
MKTVDIVRGALSLTVIVISLFLFKGTTNLINAIIIPVTLYINLRGWQPRQVASVFAAFLLLCAILFNYQIIFASIYCLMTGVYLFLNARKVNVLVRAIVLTLIASACFAVGIKLTDFIFMTQIETLLLKVLKGNLLIYYLILFVEGLIAAVSIVCSTSFLEKRLNPPRGIIRPEKPRSD